MKKNLDPGLIVNDLKGASSFFPSSKPDKITAPPTLDKVPPIEEKKQTDLLANQQTSKEANLQASKSVKKFGSYLREDSIKGLKRRALEMNKKDYEVLQEAVDLFFQSFEK